MHIKKNSIWMSKDNLPTPDMPGATRQYDFAQILKGKGYEVSIFTTSFSYIKHMETKLFGKQAWKIESVNGVKFVWIKSFPFYKNDWRRAVNILDLSLRSFWVGKRICKLKNDIIPPDVVIGFSVPLIQPLAMYYVARYYKAKFIIEVGDLWPQTIIDMGVLSRNNPVAKLLYDIEKFLYIKADKIISLLPFAKDYICSLGVPPEKVVWIPNGVNIKDYENLEERHPTNKNFNIMYLGSHAPSYGLNLIIETARIIQSKYPNIHFILVGDGAEKRELKRRSIQLNLKNVQFWEPVAKIKTPRILQQADICLLTHKNLPLLKYGMSSNKLFEYMAAKKPVIFCSNAPCDIIKKAQCGICVPPQNPKALAEAIIYLYKMSFEERRSMGERGYKYVKKYYDLQVLGDKFEQCITEVLKR